jgi:hypothetical protein
MARVVRWRKLKLLLGNEVVSTPEQLLEVLCGRRFELTGGKI